MPTNFFDYVAIGFALAIGFRGLDEILNAVDSFLQHRKNRKSC